VRVLELPLSLLTILGAAWLLGTLARRLKAPPVLGMIIGGALAAQLLPALPLPTGPPIVSLAESAPRIREAVLAVVLLRAGLTMSRERLSRAGTLALRLGTLPLLGDAALLTLGGLWLLGLPPTAALVAGLTMAAISPAIVIPGLLAIVGKRKGADRRVPTALLAGAPLDNVLCITALGVALHLARGGDSDVATLLWRLPLGLAGAVLAGLIAGVAGAWAIQRCGSGWLGVSLLWALAGALIAIGHLLALPYVISIVTLGAAVRARRAAVHQEVAPLDRGLVAVWNVVQYALFGLIGAALDLEPLAQAGLLLGAMIGLGQLGRAAMSWLATSGAGLSTGERTACVVAYVPKATIQAAFGGAALDQGMAEGNVILAGAILSIVLCAPVGMVLLHGLADRLLPGAPETQTPRPDDHDPVAPRAGGPGSESDPP
jgi:Kef-type K+ transport system membrane component KefB